MFISIKTNYDGLQGITIDKDTITDVIAFDDHIVINRIEPLRSIKAGIDAYEDLISYLNGSRYEASRAVSSKSGKGETSDASEKANDEQSI